MLKDVVISALLGVDIKLSFFVNDAIRQVNIDKIQIKQAIYNIVDNAKEAMDGNGRLRVSCKNIDIPEEGFLILNQGKYIKISFEDQGCGISKESLGKIFDPYFSTKNMGIDKGQGLGLTISYSIIKKHGGLITVESELNTGSTFSIYLPTTAPIKKVDSKKSGKKPTALKSSKQHVINAGKILFLDDEKSIRTFLGQLIKRLGYEVETCTEGRKAVETYKKAMELNEPFDVVILDLTNKVGMGGQEAIKKLLKIDHNIRVIIITGYSDDPVVANFKTYGFSDFLVKPTFLTPYIMWKHFVRNS